MEAEKRPRCPCYMPRKDFAGFIKIMDLKNIGLIIYRHTTRMEKIDKTDLFPSQPSSEIEDVFVLHNTKNTEISADELVPELEQQISCPRCKYIIEHAQRLLHRIPTINKNDIKGICHHCLSKEKNQKSCRECRNAVKKFALKLKTNFNKDTKQSIKASIKNAEKLLNNIRNAKLRSYSESYLNKRNNFESLRQPDVIPMFGIKISLPESSQCEPRIQKQKLIKSERVLTFLNIENESNEELCQVKENSSETINFVTGKETGRSLSREQSNISKSYHVNEIPRHEHVENDNTNELSKNKIMYSIHSPIAYMGRKYHSEETLIISNDILSENDFSYQFLKNVANENNRLRNERISSADLITDTLEMLRLRTEENKLKIFKKERERMLRNENKISKAHRRKQADETKMILALTDLENESYEKTELKVSDQSEAKQKLAITKTKDKEKYVAESAKISKSKEEETIEMEDKKKKNKVKAQHDKEEKERLKAEKEEQKRKDKEEKLRQKELKKAEKINKDTDKQKRLEKNKADKELAQKEKSSKKIDKIEEKNKDEKKRYKEAESKNIDMVTKHADEAKNTNQQVKIHKENKTLLKEENNGKAKEAASSKFKDIKDSLVENKLEPEKSKFKEKIEKPTRELNINEIKLRKPSIDDTILRLVQLKKSEARRDKPQTEIYVPPAMIKTHLQHFKQKQHNCIICNDSDLEIDLENIANKTKQDEIADIIIGKKIMKCKLPLIVNPVKDSSAISFQSSLEEKWLGGHAKNVTENVYENIVQKKPGLNKFAEQEIPKGVIRYALSDRTFIDKGWTMLPTEKIVRKMNVYRMRPSHPEFDWFEHNKNKRLILYDTGEKFAEFEDNGRSRWFYKNGRLALDYYNAEEMNAQQRYVIYSSGEPDERGRFQPITILATFDHLGNGVVFDTSGKIRLKYNQTEGVVLDRSIGPVSHWQWHTLNDPPVLQQVMIDTQMAHKDPDILKMGGSGEDKTRPDNEDMLAIEFDNFIKEKSKKMSQKFKPFQIKMKALKISPHFSLRVLDQATIYLIFREGSINIKLNIGMILDHQEIVDTDTAEVGEVSNTLERFPARTDSLAGLQRSIAHAQRVERLRIERERRLRPSQPCTSADQLTAAASHPLRTPLRTDVSVSPSATAKELKERICKCRKLSYNVYYDTRLF